MITTTKNSPTQRQPESIEGAWVSLKTLIAMKAEAAALSLSARSKSHAIQAGQYVSPFRGRGIDFNEVRIYQPGDDIRNIDWRVTARTGQTHTKLYTEERERIVFLVIDNSAHMQFGSRVAFKSVIAAKIAALLAWTASDNGDRIGGIVYHSDKQNEVKPTRGHRGVLRLLSQLANSEPHTTQYTQSHTFLDHTLPRLSRLAKPGNLVCIISDFQDYNTHCERHLRRLTQHCDVITIQVIDHLEHQLPPPGHYQLSDGMNFIEMDTTQRKFVEQYQQKFLQRQAQLTSFCKKNKVHYLSFYTDDNITEKLRRVGSYQQIFACT